MIVLTLVMIGGVITVVALLVTRMPQALQGVPKLPEGIEMPEGTQAEAVTFGKGWIAVVTGDGRILVFNAEGRLRQEVRVEGAEADGP